MTNSNLNPNSNRTPDYRGGLGQSLVDDGPHLLLYLAEEVVVVSGGCDDGDEDGCSDDGQRSDGGDRDDSSDVSGDDGDDSGDDGGCVRAHPSYCCQVVANAADAALGRGSLVHKVLRNTVIMD